MTGMVTNTTDQDADDEAFLRRLVVPEEDRHPFMAPWSGGYRWFQSENIIPIERGRAELQRRRALASGKSTG